MSYDRDVKLRNTDLVADDKLSLEGEEHVFEKRGRFLLQTTVSNQYGEQSKNITVVVVDPLMEEAFFILEEQTSTFEKGTPISFLVSLETTIRPNTVMQINFGNEDLEEVSLGEHQWNNQTKEYGYRLDYLGLVASYGEGCNLTIEFQYQYDQQGVFMPSIMFDNQTESLTMLDENIIILNRLVGLKIFSPKTTAINTSTEFKLIFEKSSFNISVLWTIAASSGDISDQMRSNSPHLPYLFTHPGRYVIHANVSNAISKVYSSFDILVQVPVSEIDISCKPEQYLVNGSQISCYVQITHGTHASFVWSFNDRYGLTFVDTFDLTSYSNHTFSQPGSYQVQITISNDVSHRTKIYPLVIGVENILHQVMLIQQSPTVLGESTRFKAGTHDTTPNAENIQFEFDFGSGPKSFKGEQKDGEFEMSHRFDEAGIYKVVVFARNNISEVSTSVIVYVEKPVDHGIARMLLPAVVHLDSIFIITCQEEICQRDNVIYKYQFDDIDDVIVSKSPVIFHKFTSPNLHTLNYTMFNQVGSVSEQFKFEIVKILIAPKVIHHAIVSVGEEVDFRIIGIEYWERITSNYNDNTEDIQLYPIDRVTPPAFRVSYLERLPINLRFKNCSVHPCVHRYLSISKI
ncbi:hypothetical protein LOTGIDRAFT_173468 [Lottia gigantea]|uniref:PKD domain-containing protein n=1 Tax=Lottia gigantea TaxID=225164 RepID=V4ARL7_LOTGI|nr:hypothetical protein LOTGIDRAFT_173468 [Lottia gigantea]ESO99867.1 hypothetical protein LOTGIDRAFT_173468 [Lottia gigantea]